MRRSKRGWGWLVVPACGLTALLAGCGPVEIISESDDESLDRSLAEDDCWRARFVRYSRSGNLIALRPDLSYGSFRARGRTLTGCADLDG